MIPLYSSTFEELGVDRLFMDKAHYYKDLFMHMKMWNVSSISQTEVQKSSDMFGKCRYMDEISGGKGVILPPAHLNLPELISIWKEAADIQTVDMLNLPVPKDDSINVTVEPSEFQQEMVAKLGGRAKAVRNGEVKPTEDNMLWITSDGHKMALDQRLQNPLLPNDPESKVNACVKNILTE